MHVTSYNLFDVKTKILFRLYRVTCTYVAVQTLHKYTYVHLNEVGYQYGALHIELFVWIL